MKTVKRSKHVASEKKAKVVVESSIVLESSDGGKGACISVTHSRKSPAAVRRALVDAVAGFLADDFAKEFITHTVDFVGGAE